MSASNSAVGEDMSAVGGGLPVVEKTQPAE